MEWERKWFQHGAMWIFKENQRKFLDKLGNRLGVSQPKDWGKINTQQVIEAGGGFAFFFQVKND